MARYDRRILVPYLLDVYCIELLRYRMNRQLKENEEQLAFHQEKADRWLQPPQPVQKSDWEETENKKVFYQCMKGFVLGLIAFLGLAWLAEMIIGAVGGGSGNKGNLEGVVIIIEIVLGFFIIFCGYGIYSFWTPMWVEDERSLHNKERVEREYKDHLNAYHVAEEERPYHREMITQNKEKISEAEEILPEADKLAGELYAANIIPQQYRNNVYAAFYLYDYFSTSREDDVDLVLQTYVLETIKQRLDLIIENQESLLACQQTLIQLVENQHQELLRLREDLLDSLEDVGLNQTSQAVYLDVIDTNIRVGTFFSTLHYLRE